MAALPVRVRFSTLAMGAREKVTLEATVSVPELISSLIASLVESTM